MPPESLRNIFENLETGFMVCNADFSEKSYTPQSKISIKDLDAAINRIREFIKNENKETENIPEVSWEEMMHITTEE